MPTQSLLARSDREILSSANAMSNAESKTERAHSREEYFRVEAEACERGARKASSATVTFNLLDLAAEFRQKAAQAAAEAQKTSPE